MARTQDEWATQWPLHHAAQGGKGAAQRLENLLGTEVSLSGADRQAGTTALTDAQRRELLDQKETDTGRTALHYAVSVADLSKEGSTRPTQVLLENGADVFALDKDGRTPLDLALSFRDWEYDSKRLQVVSMLRSEVDAAWSKGRRPSPWSARHPWDNGYKEHHPLHEACCRDDLLAVQRILGPILNDTTGSLTPSQTAVALDDEDFDELNSEATDQLEARNAYGHTPLLVAAGNGAFRAAALLLKHGADIAAKDANGKNALDLARMHENQDMLSLLLNGSGTTDGGVPGAPVAPQAKAALEAQAGEEVDSEEESEEEEDPIAAALAKAAAAIAKADADHAEDTSSSRPRAAPRSSSVVPTGVSHVNTSSVPAGASDGNGSKVAAGTDEPSEVIVQVSTYSSEVRAKRDKLARQRDDAASSSINRKPQPPADTAAQADQAVQAHLQNLEDRREAMRWDANIDSMVRDEPEYGTLHVRGAIDTPRADTYSDNDLYAVIVWNDKEIGRTRCIRNNNSPMWDEFFDLRVFPGVNTLRIQLWEQDKFPEIGEATADMNSRDEFMGHVIVEGASSNRLPRKVKEFELTGKDELETRDRKAERSMKSGPDKGLGRLSFCYTPKPRTPVSKRRAHKNKTRSSAPLPTDDLMKEQLLDTRRLDFTFCGLDSCKGIAAVAAKYAIPTWTSKSTKRAKKHLQLHVRGELGAGDAKVRAIEMAASKVKATVAMPPINSPRGHNAALPQAVRSTVHRSPRNDRARPRGTGAKTARGGRTRRPQHEIDEPNCMYDTFGWLTTRQRKEAAKDKDGDGKQTSSRHAVVDSITLANNELHSLAHFEESITPFLALHTTHMLQHLDLSCNRLTSLYIWAEGAALVAYMKDQQSVEHRSGSPSAPPRVSALTRMPNLHTLYLHVNALHSSHDLDAIAELKVLRNLSLHGNPLEEKFSNLSSATHGRTNNTDAASPNGVAPNAATEASGYRLSVIAKIPWLRKLDFVTVTKGERLAISNEATRLSARGLRRRQRMLEQAGGGAHSATQPHRPGAEGHYVSGTHKLVHTLQRIHVSIAAGEQPEKIVAKAVIDTGRN